MIKKQFKTMNQHKGIFETKKSTSNFKELKLNNNKKSQEKHRKQTVLQVQQMFQKRKKIRNLSNKYQNIGTTFL